MNTRSSLLRSTRALLAPALGLLGLGSIPAADLPDSPAGFAFSQLGSEADKQSKASSSIIPTKDGAQLRAQMQDLVAEATAEGLWLTSTADEDAGKANRFRVKAVEVARSSASGTRHSSFVIPPSGTVRVSSDSALWLRPGLVEEYRVSTDGVRQDFVVMERPAGAGPELAVDLEVTGAVAAAADYGAKLTVTATGRELAYSRLKVMDATGKELSARFEVAAADRLRVVVEDAGAAYPVRIDPTFSDADWVSLNPGVPGASSDVRAVATDASGNLYIGGYFTAVGAVPANYIAKWNGSTWSSLGTGMDDRVETLAVMGGDLYAGGNFINAGGVTVNRIARWNGTTWSALGSGMSGIVYSLEVNGTDLYAGGAFSTAGGVSAVRIAKWNGTTWSALGSGMNGNVIDMVFIGGDLYAGGQFTTAGGVTVNRVAKWDGSAWSALGTGMSDGVNALGVIGTDLYAGGHFTTAGGVSANRIAKWNGSAWSALGTGLNSSVDSILVSGTDMYVGGFFTTAGGASANRIAKWNGTAWSAMGTGMTSGNVLGLVMIGSDIYAGGTFTRAGSVIAARLAKWNGSDWSSVGAVQGIDNTINAVAVSGSNLYVGGYLTSAGGVAANRIAKWNGSAWSALGTGITGSATFTRVDALAVSGSDLYVGGLFDAAGGTPAFNIAKWNGSAWSALGSGMSDNVTSLTVDGGGNLYAGGAFTVAGGTTVNRVAKWNGSAWSALGTGMNGTVNALTVIGTDLYAGGNFTTADGLTANRIAKWDGSAWSALGTGMNNGVLALGASGSNLYAGGHFTTAGGVTVSYIAKWNGSAWSALGTGVNNSVYALVTTGSDLYVASRFMSQAGGVPANRVAKWNGSAWSALGSGVNGEANALATNGTKLYVGGAFTTAGSTLSPFIVQGNLAPAVPSIVSVAPSVGSSSGGTSVTITGADFTGTTGVTIGGLAAASFTVVNDGLITATTPAHAEGAVSVEVTNANGTNAANTLFTYLPAPTVSSISPSSGSTAGGTSVTISGTNFTGTTGVTIGGVAATSVTVVDATTITATTPAGTAGTSSVLVTTPIGTSAANSLYTYVAPPTLTSVSPSSATAAGGTSVTITGTGFTGATGVTIGGVAATSVTVVSGTQITAVTGAGTVGPASVLVTTPYGTNAANTAFTYLTPPLAASYTSANDVPLTVSSYTASGKTVDLSLGFTPAIGSTLMIVKNTGLGFITGQFSNLAQGQTVTLSYGGQSYQFVANYYGGTGNDLVLHWKDTKLMAWGNNGSYGGVLGINSDTLTSTGLPTAVNTAGVLAGKTIIASAQGEGHSLALCSDGTLAAWGFGGGGQLGTGSFANSIVPTAVDTSGVLAGKTIIAIAAGGSHSLALCSDGTVAAWGYNPFGSVGDGSTSNRSLPVLVSTSGVLAGKTVVAIDAGKYHSLALCSDGTVVAWGANFAGELGNGNETHSSVPVLVSTSGGLAGKTVVAISGGNGHSLALCSDGTAVAWGSNLYGALGNGTNTSSNVPVAVSTSGVLSGKTVSAISAGSMFSLALCSDGTVAAWGYNHAGQLGNHTQTDSNVPVAVSTAGLLSGKVVIAVAAADSHGLAVCSDGTLAAWGNGAYGRLGDNSTNTHYHLVPTAVNTSTMASGDRFIDLSRTAGTGEFSIAIAASPQALPPTVVSISPGVGPVVGGTNITITGTDFTGATAVTIGGVAATSVTVVNDTTITATTPAGTAGTASVLVTTPGGTNAANTLFTYNSPPTNITLSSSSIAENNAAGATVGTLSATDVDAGQTHTFSLVTGDGADDNTSFTITNSTLTLNGSANYEAKNSYSIRVQANDGNTGTIDKVFTITVTDVNDAPVITSNGGGATGSVDVAENTTAVTTVVATDADVPAQTLTYSKSGTDAAFFTIDGSTGVLAFTVAPNYEIPLDAGGNNVYNVTVTATDNGTGTLSDSQDLAITVTFVSSGVAFGSGTTTLTGQNPTTGAATIGSGGTLILNGTAGANTTFGTDGVAGNTDITLSGGTLQILQSEQIGDNAGIVLNSGAFNFGGASGLTETIGTFTNNGGTFSTGANTLKGTGATVTWAAGTNTVSNGGNVQDAHIVITGGTNTVEGGATGGVLQLLTGGTGLEMSAGSTLTLNSDNTVAGKLLLQGNASITGNATVTIASGLALANAGNIDLDGATRTFTVADGTAADDLLVSAIVTNGSLTKAGAGTMKLTGANTYSGATTISAGTLALSGAGALSDSSAVNVNGATGVFDLSGITASSETVGSLAGVASSSVILGAKNLTAGGDGTSTTFTGVISGTDGSFTKAGTGTLTLNGANTYTGATTVSAGVLNIQHATALGTTAAGTSVTSGAVLEIEGGITTGAEALTLNGTGISSGGALRNISGANNFAGLVTLGSATRINSDAGTLTLSHVGTITGSGLGLTVGGAGNTTINSIIGTATGTLTKDGAGTLTLAGANTYSGGTTVNAGTIVLGNQNGFGTGTVTLADGVTFRTSGFEGNSATGALPNAFVLSSGTVNVDVSFTGANDMWLNTSVSGAGGLSVTAGAGTVRSPGLMLSGAKTFTGGVTIGNNARVTIDNNASLGTGGLQAASGTGRLRVAGNLSGVTNNVAIANGVTLSVEVDSGLTGVLSGVISGSGGSLTKDSAGTLTLSGANTYTGATTISAGVLNIQNADALGTTAAGTSVASGAALQIQGTITTGAEALTLNGTGVSDDGALRNISDNNHYAGLVTLGSATRINSDSGILRLTNTGTITGAGFGLTVGGNGETTIDGIIGTDTGSLTKDGGGSLYLTGANTYTGTTTISSGQLNLGLNGTTGSLSTSSAIVNNGTLRFYRTNTITQGTDFATVISGSGAVTQAGTGTTILSGANTYTGATTISAGVLNIRHATALGTTAAGTSVTSGAALEIQGDITTGAEALTLNGTGISSGGALRNISGANNFAGLVTLGSATRINSDAGTLTLSNTGTITGSGFGLTVGGAGNTAIASIIGTGSGTLTKDGAGTLTLTGANTYTGATTISAGTLEIGNGGSLSTSSAITNNGTITFNRSTTITQGTDFNSLISGTGALRKTGSGTLVLNGANTYTGTTTISGGTLQIGSGGTAGSLSTSSGITNNGALVFNRSDTITQGTDFNSVIGGSGTLTQSGSGTLVLNGNNTYTGATTISAGVVNIRHANALGTTAAGTSVTSGAALEIQGDITTGAEALTLNGTGISTTGALRNISGNNNFAGLVTLGSATRINSDTSGDTLTLSNTGTITGTFGLTVGGAGNTTIASIIGTSTGTLTKDGAGTLTLTAANTYTGTTTISAGTLALSGSGRLSDSSAVSVSGGTFDIGGVSDTVGAVTLTSGSITGTSGVLTGSSYAVESGSVSAILGGSGVALTKSTSGTVTLTGVNTYTGTTTISAGTLALSGGGRLSDSSAVSVSGGTFDIGSVSDTVAAVTLTSGSITGTSGVLTGSSYAVASGSVSAILGGSGVALTKTTAGTVTLSGVNTYTGATTISAGTLEVSGSIASGSAVGVGTAGTLSGAGTINGNATLTGGGVINLSGGSIGGTLGVTGGNWNGTGSVTGLVTSSSGTFTIGSGANLTADGGLSVTGGSIASGNSSSTITGSVNYSSTSGSTFGGVIAGTSKTLTMNGSGATLTLTAANTYTGATTISAGTLALSGSGRLSDSSAVSVSGGTFDIGSVSDTVAAVTLTSGSITGSGGTLTSSATYDMRAGSVSAKLGGSVGLTKTTAGALTLSGVNTYSGTTTISAGQILANIDGALGSGGVTLNDGGTGANNTILLAGSAGVHIANDITVANQGSGTTTIGSDNAAGTNPQFDGTLTLNKAVTLQAGSTDRTTFYNQITGTGDVTITSPFAAGRRIVFDRPSGAANDFVGNITLGGGANLQLGIAAVTGLGNRTVPDASGINFNTGALLSLAPTGSGDGETVGTLTSLSGNAGTVDLITGTSFTLTIGGDSATGTFSGVIQNTAGSLLLTKTGTGTQVLSGTSNSYSGKTVVANGTLSISTVNATASANQSLGTNAAVDLGVAATSSGTLVYTGAAGTLAKSINALGNGTDTVQNSGSGLLTLSGTLTKNGTTLTLKGGANGITVSGVIAGASANSDLIIDGGVVTLTNANTYNGPTFIRNGGTLNANVVNALPTANGRTAVTFDGTGTSVLTLGAAQSVASLTAAGTATITLNANTLTVGTSAGSTTFAGAIGGTGGLTKDGASTQVLSASNGYSGTTTVSAGTLSITGDINSSATISITGGSLSTSGADKLADSAAVTVSGGTLTVGGDDTVGMLTTSGSGSTIGGSATLTALTYALGGSSTTVDGNLGAGTITSSGTVALNGTAAATTVNITGGTLTLGANNRLADTAAVTLTGGGTLAIGAFNDTVGAVALTSGSITGSGGVLTGTSYAVASGSVSAILGGSGVALTKSTAGTVTLSGANTYTGATTVNQGTLALSGAGRLSDSSSVVVAGGTFDIGSVSDTVAGVQLTSGSITGSSGVLTSTTTYDVQSGSVSAILGGTVGLTKTTTGTVTLSGANTYTGNTTLSAGGLVVNGSIGSSADTIVNGGILQGTGTVGQIHLNSGGAINAGLTTTAGTLNTGSIAIVDGQLQFNLGGTGAGQYDQISTTGTIDLTAGGSGAKLVLDAISTLATTLANDALSGYTTTNALNSAFTLVSNDLAETISGAFAKGTFGGTKVVTISGLDYVEGLLGTGYYGRINYAGSSAAPGTLATAGNDIVLKIVTPEITVTEGATTLTDNGGYDFGDVDKVVPPIPVTKTFTIKNDGEVDLMNIAITTLTGVAAGDYSLNTTGTATNLIPGASTTFTVTFNPQRIGTRNAYFSITSNDLNEATFDIPLTGVGSVGRDLIADGTAATDSWAVTYSGVDAPATPRNSVANAVAVQHSPTADEAVAVFATGYTTNAAGNKDIYLMKYNPNSGAQMWASPVIVDGGVGGDDEAFAIAVDGSGNVVVAGYQTASLNNTDVYVAKFNGTNGASIWTKTYSGAGGGYDMALSLALDPSGNVAVVGNGRNAAANQDVFVARYLANGTEVFAYLVDGGASRTDGGNTVATDAAGNVYAAGYRNVTAGNKDCYIIKLDSTGGFVWEQTIAGTSVTMGSDDEVYSMALDASGNPVLAGTLYNSTGYDLFAAKLNAGTGAVTWQKSENPYGFNDSYRQVLVDRNGGIIMAGVSHKTATTTERYVSKYTTNGDLVWNARLNAANSSVGNLWSGGIALDGEENVVVTGFSVNVGGTRDVYTAKLKHRDGSQIWERTYDGGVAGGANDEGRAVASSLDGYVYVAGYAGVDGGTTAFLLKHYKPLTAPVQNSQSITFGAVAEQGVGGSVQLVATASSGLRVRFTVSGSGTLGGPNNDILTITGLGSVNVVASQSGNYQYAPATNVSQTLTITRQAQTITFTLPASTYYTNTVALGATASSGLAVTYTEVSDPSNVATITGSNLTFTAPGFVTVRASQAGNGTYIAAPDVDVTIEATNSAPVVIPAGIAQRWMKSYAGTGAGVGRAVALSPGTGAAAAAVMTGYTTTASGGRDIYTVQYSADGTFAWQAVYSGAGAFADEGVAVTVDGSGNVYVAGYTTVSGSNTDLILIKYNSSGNQQWVRTYSGTATGGADAATSLALLGSDVVVAGYLANSTLDFFAARINSANVEAWAYSYDPGTIEGSTSKTDSASKVAVDHNGNIALLGNSAGANNVDDIWTVKLNSSGIRQWYKRYNGTLNREDRGNGLGFDNVGNVLISGWTNGQASASTYDIYVAKYAAADGALAWQTVYNHSDNLNDSGRDLKVDSQGNAIVVGVSNNLLGNQDMWTGKFNGQTGVLAWADRYNNVRIDQGVSVSLDPNGNVIATGSSGDIDGTTDIYTVKYTNAGSGVGTGATITWTQRYEGLNSRNDAPNMVAADGAGSVYVAGYQTNIGGVTEALLVRYAPPSVTPPPPLAAPPPVAMDESGEIQVLAAAAPPPAMLQLTLDVEHGDPAQFEAEFADAEGNDTVAFSAVIDGNPGGTLSIDAEAGRFTWEHDTTTIAPGPHEVIITATDTAGASTSVNLSMTVSSNHPDRTWRWENFGSTVASGNAADDADPDGDGLANLAEFAFGLDPTRGSSDTGSRAEVSGGQGGMRAVFRRRKDHAASGLEYNVEFSSNLGDWTPSSAIPVVIADEGVLEQVGLVFPVLPDGSQSRFFRINIQQQNSPAQ